MAICGHSLGGNIATRYTGLYPDRVSKLANIEGLGPLPMSLTTPTTIGAAQRLRDWIAEKRAAAGRVPRHYPTLSAALARMREENGFLTEDQARHLTLFGTKRNEDGSWSWKFDHYLRVPNVSDPLWTEIAAIWGAITCPVLLFYGADSFATNPARDGRLRYFTTARVIEYPHAGHWLHHDQLEWFVHDLAAFLKD